MSTFPLHRVGLKYRVAVSTGDPVNWWVGIPFVPLVSTKVKSFCDALPDTYQILPSKCNCMRLLRHLPRSFWRKYKFTFPFTSPMINLLTVGLRKFQLNFLLQWNEIQSQPCRSIRFVLSAAAWIAGYGWLVTFRNLRTSMGSLGTWLPKAQHLPSNAAERVWISHAPVARYGQWA